MKCENILFALKEIK